MGSYGIGPARIVAAAVEQFADEHGISWPRSIAPWDVELVALGQAGHARARGRRGRVPRAEGGRASTCCSTIASAGPGEKFAEAELLGCPLRLTLGKRSLESGRLEAQVRRGRADHEGGVPLEGAAEAVAELWRSLP